MDYRQQRESEGYEIYRHQVVDSHGHVVLLKDAERGASRGTYKCEDCNWPVLKKRSPPCVSRDHSLPSSHFAHYPNGPKGSHKGETKQHRYVKQALAVMCHGSVEVQYPGTERIADAGNGRVFFEVVKTNDISQDKAKDLLACKKSVPGFELWTVKTKKITEQTVAKIIRHGNLGDFNEIANIIRSEDLLDPVDVSFLASKTKGGQPILVPNDTDTVGHNASTAVKRLCGPCMYTKWHSKNDSAQMSFSDNSVDCELLAEEWLQVGSPCVQQLDLKTTSPDYQAHIEFINRRQR